jgi:hypothetical protein
MFETIESPANEPAKGWYFPNVYLFWFAIGMFGALISFWKHGVYRPLGLVCYASICILSLYFYFAAKTGRPTNRSVLIRCQVLLWLSLVPSIMHQLLMK